jgi:hypothetical protein
MSEAKAWELIDHLRKQENGIARVEVTASNIGFVVRFAGWNHSEARPNWLAEGRDATLQSALANCHYTYLQALKTEVAQKARWADNASQNDIAVPFAEQTRERAERIRAERTTEV